MKIINRSSINRSQPNTPRPFSTFLALAGWPTLAWLVPFLGLTAASGEAVGAADCGDSVWDADDDERYVARFHEHHGPIDPVAPLATYLEIRNYDRFNGAVLDDRLALVARSGADQGWSPTVGVDSWSVSLNEMYRHTGDRRYFDENLKLVRVVINNRDDRRTPQEQLWNGSVVPLWSDGTYSSRGREAYVLHTGLIAYPIFDFLLLGEINGDPTRFGPAQVSVMAPFLRLTPYVPEVFSIIAAYYTYFIDSEGPLDGALLRRFESTAAVPTAVREELKRPLMMALAQPYPNPFNSSVQIEYSLAIAAPVRLEVFDVSGQRLRTLVNAQQTPGMHRAHWDADGVAAGSYIVRLRAGEWSQTRKLMLIK